MNNKKIIILAGASIAIILACLFLGGGPINPFTTDPLSKEILFALRLPRLLTAVIVGASLGASGAVLQGILRNPLSDPYILGISSGAALSAAMGLVLGITTTGYFSLPLLAFIGAVITCVIVGVLGKKNAAFTPERLLLAGIGLGFLFTAILMLLMSLSSDYGVRRTLLWIFGDLSYSGWALMPYGFILSAIGLGAAILRSNALNALALGDEFAHSLGFSPSKERFIFFVAASLMTAVSVTMGGIIGFVGLLIPHAVRFLTGSGARLLLPLSALFGATFLALADAIGKTVISPTEIPSGIITSIIGAPYFIYLIRRHGR
ncbi:MAG: iron ABC transporter permease [Thermodesulfobacteriota bacterium]